MRRIIAFFPAAVLFLCSCSGQSSDKAANTSDDQALTRREVSGQIAYVNLDTLLNNYNMFVDMSDELEKKATKAESEIASKGRSLERSFADAQEKMEKGLVTRAQAAELQEKLQRQEQNFYQYRDRVQQELMEENQVMMNNLYHNLNSFLAEFNSDYRYSMILTTTGGAPILHADPELDITDAVVRGLNESYIKEEK